MTTISIYEFYNKFDILLSNVSDSNSTYFIEKKNKIIAKICPVHPEIIEPNILGCMEGTGEIIGDLLEPIISEKD
jgi:hypothetical protein